VYYATSAASGIWNKQLVDDNAVSPTVLTLLHLLVSLASDVAIMRYGRKGDGGGAGGTTTNGGRAGPEASRHTLWDVVVSFTPISLFVIMSKLATYFSYQYVSIALSHTAKASEPIFNVIVAAAFFREFPPRPVYLSLIPIALGVALASVTDFSYNHTGFLWATVSALMKVLQNIYTKRLMNAGKFTFWEIHMYCGAASLVILAPVLLVQTATAASSPWLQ
jgi:solute carrier family 35 protein E1